MMKLTLALALVVGLAQCNPTPADKISLKGVTIESIPYLEVQATNATAGFKGFLVELMDKIAEKANLQYSLYLSPDGRYGYFDNNGQVNGMLKELVDKKADFALADFTITPQRQSVVNFTTPFVVTQIGAVLKKEFTGDAKTLTELVEKNQLKPKAEQLPFAVLRGGATYQSLSTTTDPTGKAIFDSLTEPSSFVSRNSDGLDKVKAGERLAIIVETSTAEYVASLDCSLSVVPDVRDISRREYALAVPVGSPHLAKLNDAIAQLKADGTIEQLRLKYWPGQCKDKKP